MIHSGSAVWLPGLRRLPRPDVKHAGEIGIALPDRQLAAPTEFRRAETISPRWRSGKLRLGKPADADARTRETFERALGSRRGISGCGCSTTSATHREDRDLTVDGKESPLRPPEGATRAFPRAIRPFRRPTGKRAAGPHPGDMGTGSTFGGTQKHSRNIWEHLSRRDG